MTTLRIARPTDRLEELAAMYRRGLGLTELGRFEDHDGFDGVLLGLPGQPWHLEFTQRSGHHAGGSPSDEHLLVLYLADVNEWELQSSKMLDAGFAEVKPSNPYWATHGRTFEDLDGYRVVLQNTESPV